MVQKLQYAFISGATAVKKDNVRKHAVSAMHIWLTMISVWWTCIVVPWGSHLTHDITVNLKNDQWQNFTEAVDLLCNTQILHCKMLSKVLRKICFAEQNNCYAKFQTAIHTCILHSTNCSAKKMTEFDPHCEVYSKVMLATACFRGC